MRSLTALPFSHLPTGARGIRLAGKSGEVELIFNEFYYGLNAREFSHVAQERFVNALCEHGSLILALLRQIRSALRITSFSRLTGQLSSRKMIRVIHQDITLRN